MQNKLCLCTSSLMDTQYEYYFAFIFIKKNDYYKFCISLQECCGDIYKNEIESKQKVICVRHDLALSVSLKFLYLRSKFNGKIIELLLIS